MCLLFLHRKKMITKVNIKHLKVLKSESNFLFVQIKYL